MKPRSPKDPHPLESLSTMRRRRFLSLAAFASTSVVAVGVAGTALPAEAEAAEPQPQPQPHKIDADTGWPVFQGAHPPQGFKRSHAPCDHGEYVDVPQVAATESLDEVRILKPPYQHADWHRPIGAKR